MMSLVIPPHKSLRTPVSAFDQISSGHNVRLKFLLQIITDAFNFHQNHDGHLHPFSIQITADVGVRFFYKIESNICPLSTFITNHGGHRCPPLIFTTNLPNYGGHRCPLTFLIAYHSCSTLTFTTNHGGCHWCPFHFF